MIEVLACECVRHNRKQHANTVLHTVHVHACKSQLQVDTVHASC